MQSNAADILNLGPRTAGLLLTVGIRTVEQLLAAQPLEIEQRLSKSPIAAHTITVWQHEARLVLAAPELPVEAIRIFAAAGMSNLKKIASTTPTELLTALEVPASEKKLSNAAKKISAPAIVDVSNWIRSARKLLSDQAA